MTIFPSRFIVVAAASLAAVAISASLPVAAKSKKFKPSFVAKLPGEPKGASSFKATVKGPIGNGTGFAYNDDVGSLTLNGIRLKAGLTTISATFNVNVFAGMDLTDVTFPVTREALVVFSYTKTTISLRNPTNPKIIAYIYSGSQGVGTTVTVTSYDAAKGEITGTVDGEMEFHENIQDPTDDARDGALVMLENTKFALKSLLQ